MTDIAECENCETRVIFKEDKFCPACRYDRELGAVPERPQPSPEPDRTLSRQHPAFFWHQLPMMILAMLICEKYILRSYDGPPPLAGVIARIALAAFAIGILICGWILKRSDET